MVKVKSIKLQSFKLKSLKLIRFETKYFMDERTYSRNNED